MGNAEKLIVRCLCIMCLLIGLAVSVVLVAAIIDCANIWLGILFGIMIIGINCVTILGCVNVFVE